MPYAFTEHGAIMAATVLNTTRAVGVNIYVVRAFVKLREILSEHKELALKLAELGFTTKELLGGLDWWKRDGYATEGKNRTTGRKIICGC